MFEHFFTPQNKVEVKLKVTVDAEVQVEKILNLKL